MSGKTPSDCTCFRCWPCAFCTSLTEDEAEAFGHGGVDAVEALRWDNETSIDSEGGS